MKWLHRLLEDTNIVILCLTWAVAMSMFSQDDTLSAKCALVGVWLVGIVFYEVMRARIRGDI
jgi:hypothetical protein